MQENSEKLEYVDAAVNPIYDILEFGQNQLGTLYNMDLKQLMRDILKELQLDENEDRIPVAIVEHMMRRTTLCRVRPCDRVRVNSMLFLIATTVKVVNGRIQRIQPKQDILECPTDATINKQLEVSIHNAQQLLPVKYEYEIILVPKVEALESVSLFNFENYISDYYVNGSHVVKANEIINIPVEIMSQPQVKMIQSPPICMNGVMKYLTGRDFLNMRLVCKAMVNQANDNKEEIIGSCAFDVYYRWFFDNYWDRRINAKREMTKEEFKRFKIEFLRDKTSLLVGRKYALEDYMPNTIQGYQGVPMICDLHRNYDCLECNQGADIQDILRYFHGITNFPPEIRVLLRLLIDEHYLEYEDFENIFDSMVLLCRQDYIIYLIYDYLKLRGKILFSGIHKVFLRYRKYLFYNYMVQRSSLSGLRSGCPPIWIDFLNKRYIRMRQKRQILLDYGKSNRVGGELPNLYSWNTDYAKYESRKEIDFFFKEHGYEDNDNKIFLDSMSVFFKKNYIQHWGCIYYKEANSVNNPDFCVWDTDRIRH